MFGDEPVQFRPALEGHHLASRRLRQTLQTRFAGQRDLEMIERGFIGSQGQNYRAVTYVNGLMQIRMQIGRVYGRSAIIEHADT